MIDYKIGPILNRYRLNEIEISFAVIYLDETKDWPELNAAARDVLVALKKYKDILGEKEI